MDYVSGSKDLGKKTQAFYQVPAGLSVFQGLTRFLLITSE